MPLHPSFKKVRDSMRDKHGTESGDEKFWKWVNKHGYNETKGLDEQKSKASANPVSALMEVFDEEEEEVKEEASTALKTETLHAPDKLDRREDTNQIQAQAGKKDGSPTFVSVGAFKVPYVATPKFEGKDAPVIIKAIVLEEGLNVNNWRVVSEEFERVAAQYKAGRHLRINHDKTVESVIGKSFDGKVIKGKEISLYLGRELEGVRPEGLYVAAEFEANPQLAQVRTNILQGYVETGSIGLDANAFCEKCDTPIKMKDDGTMEKSCHHYDEPVKLRNVEVKEYSYVAEPAFEHTIALPTFSAAVSRALGESSLSYIPAQAKVEMSVEAKDPKVEATAAKKAEEEKPEEDAQALAEKFIAYYKKGVADADARHMKESEVGASVVAQKTDQVAKVAEAKTGEEGQKNLYEQRWGARKSYSKADLIALTQTPTAFALDADPAIRELFKAAAEHPKAPSEVKASYRAWKTAYPGRFE